MIEEAESVQAAEAEDGTAGAEAEAEADAKPMSQRRNWPWKACPWRRTRKTADWKPKAKRNDEEQAAKEDGA